MAITVKNSIRVKEDSLHSSFTALFGIKNHPHTKESPSLRKSGSVSTNVPRRRFTDFSDSFNRGPDVEIG